jgi:hypothetical protein
MLHWYNVAHNRSLSPVELTNLFRFWIIGVHSNESYHTARDEPRAINQNNVLSKDNIQRHLPFKMTNP